MFIRRRARWLAVAVVYPALPALLACNQHALVAPDPHPEQAQRNVFEENQQLKLDIVFMVDNSNSMRDKQANLVRNFPRFMQVLKKAVPPGSTLDAHIGIVSSDLGVATDGVGNCRTDGGDNGAFLATGHDGCTATPRGSFIITSAAGNNFDGPIEDVFSCIAALGTGGCGFEHQLASVRRALGGDPSVPAPTQNTGFLRADARLGVVLITDEDDCSAPVGSDLFTVDTSVYGPLDSYRCNQFGHLCGAAPPPFAEATGLQCHSNETATTHLVKVGDFVDFLRALKPRPDSLRVAAITGAATPYATRFETDGGTTFVRPVPSCSGGVGSAAPAVRLKDFIDAFGRNGAFETICTDDFGPAMEHIASTLVEPPVGCLDKRLYDRDATAMGVQPDCTVTESTFGDDLHAIERVIPACDATGGVTPCWRVGPDARCATASPEGVAVTVDRGGASPAPNTRMEWSCRVCPDQASDGCAR